MRRVRRRSSRVMVSLAKPLSFCGEGFPTILSGPAPLRATRNPLSSKLGLELGARSVVTMPRLADRRPLLNCLDVFTLHIVSLSGNGAVPHRHARSPPSGCVPCMTGIEGAASEVTRRQTVAPHRRGRRYEESFDEHEETA